MNIEILYRIFYILFAMEMAAVALFPLMLFFRILMNNLPKKYMVWMWRLYFLRIICPIAISSPFSIVAGWNRWYHRILEGLGLTMEEEGGLLRSWSSVLHGDITTTFSYRVCAWGWLFGTIFLLGVMLFRQGRIKKGIRTREKQLDGRLYQSAVKVPVTTGIFRQRFYLPEKMEAKQAKYTVAHMEIQRKRRSAFWNFAEFIITAFHWFDPLVWAALHLSKKDEEMACDEETIRYLGMKEKGAYTQSILNMAKEETPVPYTICTIFETGLEKRAQRALHWRKPSVGQGMTGLLLLSLLFFYSFMLRPLQMAWAGGTWKQEPREVVQKTLRETETVAKASIISPGGLQHTLKLNVENGSQTGEEIKGRFSLVMEDSTGNTVDEIFLRDAFQKQGIEMEEISFSQGVALHIGDYNNDTVQEIILGQQVDWNEEQKSTVQSVLSTKEEDVSAPEGESESTPEEEDTSTSEDGSTSAPKGKTTPAPEDGSTSAPKGKTTPAPKEESTSSPKKKAAPTPKGESASSPKKKATPTPEGKATSTPKDKTKSTPEAEATSTSQGETTSVQENRQKKKKKKQEKADEDKKGNESKEDNEKTTLMKEYVYLVFQMEETSISEVSEPVYSQQMPGMESLTPGTMEDIKDIFYTSMEEGRIYYVWNQVEQRYEAQKLGEDQLNQHRLASQGTQESGVEETFTLNNNDEELMRVETVTDTTGSRAIQKIIMTKGEREMKSVEGYYCDLQWAVQSDASIGKYAILTYNGKKAQTFVVYDVENRKEFYRHEDGNTVLNRVFGQYNDSEFHFEAGSAVVYTLLEQKETLLTISFAAQAEGDITVRGVYDYDTEKESISNLQFSQSGSTEQGVVSTQERSDSEGKNGNGATSQPNSTIAPIPTIDSDLEKYLQ